MGGTDHTGHDHSAEEGVAEERQKVLKSLVAVLGIYAFFVFESVMTLLRNRKVRLRLDAWRHTRVL